METKKCTCCQQNMSIDDFRFKKTEKRYSSWCKKCIYSFQKRRWISRKIEAVKLMGNKCCICGYDKNLAALDFHHKDPNQKEMTWKKAKLCQWNTVIKELEKCILVCSNCHDEIHHPYYDKSYMNGETNPNNLLNKEHTILEPTGKCPTCQKNVYATKYCSVLCASFGLRKIINRPSKEILQEEIKNNSFVYLGKKYGVSDNAIRKWAKQYDII